MVKVNLIGFKEFEDKLKSAPAKLVNEVSHEVIDAGNEFSRLAKRDAPVDLGQLRGGISSVPVAKLTVDVVSAAKHSPYIEWGTITKVKVPGELQEYAIQFKGKGIRKNGGILPRPFFFKQMPIVRKKFIERIQNVLSSI